MQTDEKRKFPRLALKTEIWLGQDGIFTRTNETLGDLSEGGAFIETRQRYPTGSILTLRFKLPEAAGFITSTIIIRNTRDDTGLGVEFLDLSPEDHRQIRAFIERRLAGRE
ncbi:MAG TPA: PilZ domain-containing protein [Blastocatellia bacterium]|nr:PilZ domain-containing protein [Blastocatellia bacterium]